MRLLIPATLLVFVNHLSFGQGNIKIVLLTDSTIFTNYVDLITNQHLMQQYILKMVQESV